MNLQASCCLLALCLTQQRIQSLVGANVYVLLYVTALQLVTALSGLLQLLLWFVRPESKLTHAQGVYASTHKSGRFTVLDAAETMPHGLGQEAIVAARRPVLPAGGLLN